MGICGWVAAAVVALVASVALVTADRTVPIDLPEMRLQIVTPPAATRFRLRCLLTVAASCTRLGSMDVRSCGFDCSIGMSLKP